jgi:hypothetical protein
VFSYALPFHSMAVSYAQLLWVLAEERRCGNAQPEEPTPMSKVPACRRATG